MSPSIAVITPTYNRVGSLGRAIESVLAQAHGDFEYLVVDDGSTDGSEDLVRGYGDARIRYVKQPQRQGANAARNLGLELTTAPVVTFLDSDDFFLPHRLAHSLRRFELHPHLLLLLSSFELAAGDGKERGQPLPNRDRWLSADQLEELLLWHAFFLAGSSITVRREVLRAAGGGACRLQRIQDRELLLNLVRHQRTAWLRGNGGERWAWLVEEVDWCKVTSADSLSAAPTGSILALGEVLACHPELLQRHGLGVRYLVAAAIANRLGRGDLQAAAGTYGENLAVPSFRFDPFSLLLAYGKGSAVYGRLFRAATSLEGAVLPPPL
jgi:hypothetical protein